MELIIDIPKKIYENAKEGLLCGSEITVNAIKNGTPLNDVLQEIRQEIDDICVFDNVYKNDAIVGCSYIDGFSVKEEVIAIINSYLDKELSE